MSAGRRAPLRNVLVAAATLAAVLTLATLAACGQKGPLTLPSPQPRPLGAPGAPSPPAAQVPGGGAPPPASPSTGADTEPSARPPSPPNPSTR